MARGGYRDVFNGEDAVRVEDVEKAPETDALPSLRVVNGPRPKASDMTWVLLGVSSPVHLACLEYLVGVVENNREKKGGNIGRPREHTVADWMLFWRASDLKGSLTGAEDMLVGDDFNWDRAREVVAEIAREVEADEEVEAKEGSEHEYLLSEKEMDRSKFHRFRMRHIGEEEVEELRKIIRSHAVKDARSLGLFPDKGGSTPTLNVDRAIYGDGSELKTMFNPRRKRVDPDTGEITYSRHDPDAIAHHHHHWVEDPYTGDVVCKFCEANKQHKKRGDGLDGPLCYEMVTVLTRTDLRQERIVLDLDLRKKGQHDANKFTDMTLDMQQVVPELTDLPLVVVYDGRMGAVDADRLQSKGNPVVRKVANDPNSRIKKRCLRDQKFTLADGSEAVRDLYFVDGTPALKEHDGDAAEWFVKLKYKDMQPVSRSNSEGTHKDLYVVWRVADHRLASKWASAEVRVRQNSTQKEIDENNRRTVYVRPCPETHADHQKLFGRREDAESFNATYKSGLNGGRVRSVGRVHNQLNLLAFQMNENDTAMYAHHWRLGYQAAYDERFSYRPKRLKKPLLKAA